MLVGKVQDGEGNPTDQSVSVWQFIKFQISIMMKIIFFLPNTRIDSFIFALL